MCHDVARPAGSVPTALTAEQAEIVAIARSLGTQPVPLAVLVTAAAGTGETTVLEAVVAKPESVRHTAGQCVVFGKAAADDAERRMQQTEPVPGGLGPARAGPSSNPKKTAR